METSIFNIIRNQLIGKEIKLYKYDWGENGIKYYYEEQEAYYNPSAYLGFKYVKIENLTLGSLNPSKGLNGLIATLILKKNKFITISSIDIMFHSDIELKEKED
jgi:hypothetical protein